MHVLVTGGAGFIGSHIVDALVARGDQVTIIDAFLPAAWGQRPALPGYLNPAARFVPGDVRDIDLVTDALTGVDAVCHQAAMVGLGTDIADITDFTSINDVGTASILRAMAVAGTRHLVLASSMVVYGEGGYACLEHGPSSPGPRSVQDLDRGQFEPICLACYRILDWSPVGESASFDPRSVYAATKTAQEYLATAWARVTESCATKLRYHNVYGPRMPRNTPYAGVASIFRSSLEDGCAPAVYEDGGQLRDFVHVRDVATANLAALDARESGAFNIASGTPHTVGEMASSLAAAFGGPSPVITGQYRLGDVRHIVASSEQAEKVLGFRAEIDFSDGIHEFARTELRG